MQMYLGNANVTQHLKHTDTCTLAEGSRPLVFVEKLVSGRWIGPRGIWYGIGTVEEQRDMGNFRATSSGYHSTVIWRWLVLERREL